MNLNLKTLRHFYIKYNNKLIQSIWIKTKNLATVHVAWSQRLTEKPNPIDPNCFWHRREPKSHGNKNPTAHHTCHAFFRNFNFFENSLEFNFFNSNKIKNEMDRFTTDPKFVAKFLNQTQLLCTDTLLLLTNDQPTPFEYLWHFSFFSFKRRRIATAIVAAFLI